MGVFLIMGINLLSIEAKKLKAPQGSIRIDNNTRITSVRAVSMPQIPGKVCRIEFAFETKYSHGKGEIGHANITGEMIYKGKTSEICDYWKENNKLPEEVAMPVMNAILRKCIARTIDLSEHLMLPPPINFPVVKQKQQQNIEYIG